MRPSVGLLYAAPELATLEILATAIDVALVALVAAHPDDVADDDHVARRSPEHRAARTLIASAHELASALQRYQLAVALAHEREHPDWPF